jgi:hypothetical protein
MKERTKEVGLVLGILLFGVVLIGVIAMVLSSKENLKVVEEDLVTHRGAWQDAETKLMEEKEKVFDWEKRWESLIKNNFELTRYIKELEKPKSEPKIPSIIEIIPKIKLGVVHIDCPQWQGSGFVVAKNIIVTARHCVKGVEKFVITTNDGHKLNATKALSSEKHDIAFIYINDLTCQLEKDREIECDKLKHKVKLHVLKLGSITECQLGQELITIGSPYGKVNFNSITLGIISGLDRDYGPLNNSYYGNNDYGWSVAFQTDSPGHPGNSGCAVFTADGVVRGIVVGGFSPSLVIAMPVDLFLDDLEEIKRMFVRDKYYYEKVVQSYEEAAYDFFTEWKQ